jgi:hypothetical protein
LDLLFKKQYPQFEMQLKNVKNESETQELLKKKESFIQKKMAMKARFLANKTQTFRNILKKFIRRKKYFTGFRKGRNKIPLFKQLGRIYKKSKYKNSYMYRDFVVFNKRYKKP